MISVDSFIELYRTCTKPWNLLDLNSPLHPECWKTYGSLPGLSGLNYDCTIYLPINLVHWSFLSPFAVFPLTCRSEPPWDGLCDASMSSSSSSCRPSLAMIRSSPLRLRTNLNFLVVFFFLMRRRTPSTRHLLLHLEYSSLERTPSALIPIIINKIDILWYQLLCA